MIDGKKSLFVVHSSLVLLESLGELCRELLPGVEVRHIVDDSLLKEVIRRGGVTTGVRQRMCSYFALAEQAGADLILVQCSSVGEVAEFGSALVDVPILRIDRPMAEHACGIGRRIGVVATLETTLGPTARLVRRVAEEMGKQIQLEECLCRGAFEAVSAGDKATHNRLVTEGIKSLADKVDVILCAQGSMVALLSDPEVQKVQVPILTSVRSGIERVGEMMSEA